MFNWKICYYQNAMQIFKYFNLILSRQIHLNIDSDIHVFIIYNGVLLYIIYIDITLFKCNIILFFSDNQLVIFIICFSIMHRMIL